MSKFVSKIDGKVFETKEELLTYLENEYVKVDDFNEDSMYVQILTKLKEAFPEANVEITEHNYGDRYYIELRFYVGKDVIESFDFEIGNEVADGYNQVFETIEDAIDFYGQYPKQTEAIRELLADKYELDSFKINQWYEADAYSDNYHKVTLDVKVNGIDMFLEIGLFAPLDNIIKTQVESYFTNEIEGEVRQYSFGEWYVGGSDLDAFLNRAKKVKVTIIESK